MPTTLATAVTKQLPDKHLPDGQALAGVAARTRLPYSVVGRVVNEKNRSSEQLPSPLRSEEQARVYRPEGDGGHDAAARVSKARDYATSARERDAVGQAPGVGHPRSSDQLAAGGRPVGAT